ncbi:5555_t:CDS:2, partial [Racocetra fulgida]
SDKEIIDFMDFISQYVPGHSKDSYEDVVKAFQENAVDAKIFQYYRRYKNENSEASNNVMDFISQYVPEHPKGSYEDVVKAFQAFQGSNKPPLYRSRSKEDLEIVQKAFNRTFQDP